MEKLDLGHTSSISKLFASEGKSQLFYTDGKHLGLNTLYKANLASQTLGRRGRGLVALCILSCAGNRILSRPIRSTRFPT